MLDALETGPEIEMMMLEWDSFAKNNLVSDDSIFYTSNAADKIEPRWSRESVFAVLAFFGGQHFQWSPSYVEREFSYSDHVLIYLFQTYLIDEKSDEYKTCFYCYSCS